MHTKLIMLNDATRVNLNQMRRHDNPNNETYIVLKGHDEDLNKVSLRLPTQHADLVKLIDENSNHALSFVVDETGYIQRITMIV